MEIKIFDLGLVDYKKAWDFQKEIFLAVRDNKIKSALISCSHYPVITLGRPADKRNILASPDELGTRGIKTYVIERGGDVTYHGPGQLMLYPLLNLNYFKKDIHWFLRQLEEIALSFLSDFGISPERKNGLTGVWINNKKISSVGIAIRNWITFHGLSLNICEADLPNFGLIRPCGMDIQMTSLDTELHKKIDPAGVKEALLKRFFEVFDLSLKEEALWSR